jgi:hypothetical protein
MDDSIASFSGDGAKSPSANRGKSPKAAISLADLVADDENWGFRANNASSEGMIDGGDDRDETMAMDMTSAHHGGIVASKGEPAGWGDAGIRVWGLGRRGVFVSEGEPLQIRKEFGLGFRVWRVLMCLCNEMRARMRREGTRP